MKDKINIAELLKDCPNGMELDSTLIEGLEFDSIVDSDYLPIRCRIKNPNGGYNVYNFTKHGCWFDSAFAKCLIFPKGKTTWEGFVPPCKFKDGDIVATNSELQVFILQRAQSNTKGYCYIGYDFESNEFFDAGVWEFERLATEEEKQKLFDAIKANGYKWNPESKTLEELVEPKFKVGDRVKHIPTSTLGIVTKVDDAGYYIDKVKGIRYISFSLEKDYELAPNKFDITTLVPFEDKVLVRNDESQRWLPAFWGYKVVDGFITTFGWCKYCIPYKGNEILFKTNNDCDDFYKAWEK